MSEYYTKLLSDIIVILPLRVKSHPPMVIGPATNQIQKMIN